MLASIGIDLPVVDEYFKILLVCLDASFVPGIWGKAIILNSIRRKFWVWLK